MDVDQRRLRRWDQEHVVLAEVKLIVLELGQMAGGYEGISPGDDRRRHLRVSVLLGMDVEHEVDESTAKASARPFEELEVGPCYVGGPLEVHDVQADSDLPVWLRLEIELPRLPPLANDDVLVLSHSLRGPLVHQVGNLQGEARLLGLDLAKPLFQLLDAVAHLPHLGDLVSRVPALPLDLGDLLTDAVALRAQPLHLGQQRPPLLVGPQQTIERRGIPAALLDSAADEFRIAADESNVEHRDLRPLVQGMDDYSHRTGGWSNAAAGSRSHFNSVRTQDPSLRSG